MKKDKDHPEVSNIKNICDITPDAKSTRDVCSKVNKNAKKAAKTKLPGQDKA